ncbi:MAG: chorismate synthase [Thermoleophilia bacterium]|nr:chorismate synthase [Thermoleophilia bacterium]
MTALELTTAGESHGPRLTAIVRGLPSGLGIDRDFLDAQLARRQAGYGRSPRQKIETDRAEVTGGLRHGRTMGGPVALDVVNRDHAASWDAAMAPWPTEREQGNWRDRPILVPRPGHADLGGIARGAFDEDGLRPVLERSSARETAARVAGGSLAQAFLAQLGIQVRGFVRQVGAAGDESATPTENDACWGELDARELRTPRADVDAAMVAEVEAARRDRDTLGGELEVVAWGLPPGIGGYATNEERLDGRLARAAMSVHAMKSFAVGDGRATSTLRGSEAHDELFPAGAGDGDQGMGVTRRTNRAGGIEGGMTNGAPLVVRVGMKPLPTLMRPLATVDLTTGEAAVAHAERSDTCAIAAAAVVLESAIAFELARVLREQFGAQALVDVLEAFEAYRARVRYPKRPPVVLSTGKA